MTARVLRATAMVVLLGLPGCYGTNRSTVGRTAGGTAIGAAGGAIFGAIGGNAALGAATGAAAGAVGGFLYDQYEKGKQQ